MKIQEGAGQIQPLGTAGGAAMSPGLVIVLIGAVCLLIAGLLGKLNAAWGYGLFLLAALSLSVFLVWTVGLLFTRLGNSTDLLRRMHLSLRCGVGSYVLAVSALAGYYSHETLAGRMEWHWVVFGPLALAALVAFEWGIYAKLIKANSLSWQRYQRFIDRSAAQPQVMRDTFKDEVVLHRTLWQTSRLRWLRHTLIFWGFAGMFGIELAAVFLREAVPAFGWPDIWRQAGHPVRMAFDFAYDTTGLMMLIGCVLALYWRWTVRGLPEQKYADTPMVLFLGFVVFSGFVVEGWRLALNTPGTEAVFSYVGLVFAAMLKPIAQAWQAFYHPIWLVHVVASCALIAYIPFSRLVHSCATPVGRLMNSQKALLAAKKMGVLRGLFRSPAQSPQTFHQGERSLP